MKWLRFVMIISVMSVSGMTQDFTTKPDRPDQREPMSLGKPLSYWMGLVRNRGDDIAIAFQAIRELGPLAWPAVPELTLVVTEPFVPVRVGIDDHDTVLSKIDNIELRAAAIDTLASIGDASAVATLPLLRWAMLKRVIPEKIVSKEESDLYGDLVAVDVLERMRVGGAVAQFGPGAAPAIAAFLESADGEERKLAVAILNDAVLPLVAALLKSPDCKDRKLGLAILTDMWPVVSRDHLLELRRVTVCTTVGQ
jgi:hypothetical protein